MSACLICGDPAKDFCYGCNAYISARSGQKRASVFVAKAIKEGVILPACAYQCADCGKQATQYDHRDYSRPLDISPVCGSCNVRRGPGKPYWYLLPKDREEHRRRHALFSSINYQHGKARRVAGRAEHRSAA